MIPLTVSALATLVGGRLRGDGEVLITDDVVTDSRQARPGSLYVARVGEQADGHDFIEGARAAGAVAVLCSKPTDALPAVVVDDVQDAFARLGRWVVDQGVCGPGSLRVIGVTGSSGKTSTKDLLGHVLGRLGPTVAPVGSLNSEVGVPLTVCRVVPDTNFLVVEMGARGLGHVDYLTTIAPPQVGVVLNVGSAHVGEFGSRETIAVAKGELVAALPPAGLAVLNADDAAVRAMRSRTSARVVLVGEAADADVRATEIVLDGASRPTFTVRTAQGERTLTLQLSGRHQVGNALAVLAVALECGMSLQDAVGALEDARPLSRWRMELTERPDGVVIVNDAYNANPESMRAALGALAGMRATKRWAVLGSMLELGADSEEEHAGIGLLAVSSHVDELVAVGAPTRPMAEAARAHAEVVGARTQVRWVASAEEAEAILREELAPGHVVLFKSSNAVGLRWLGDRVSGRLEERS